MEMLTVIPNKCLCQMDQVKNSRGEKSTVDHEDQPLITGGPWTDGGDSSFVTTFGLMFHAQFGNIPNLQKIFKFNLLTFFFLNGFTVLIFSFYESYGQD